MANDNNKKEIGVITEQGDLGLGFNILNEQDSKAYENAPKREEDKKKND